MKFFSLILLVVLALAIEPSFSHGGGWRCLRLSIEFFEAPEDAEEGEDCEAAFVEGTTETFDNFKANQEFLEGFEGADEGHVCCRKVLFNRCTNTTVNTVFGLVSFDIGLFAFNRTVDFA